MRRIWAFSFLLLALFALWGGITYNRLVRAEQAVAVQWAQLENVLQRRLDLVPNLVAATRGIFLQERAIVEAVVQARTRYLATPPGSPTRVQEAARLEASLGRLLAVIERYPELRSSEAVQSLMDEIAGTENRVAVERRRYNERVRDYNTLLQRFPTFLVARIGGFTPRPYFQATRGAEEAPETPLQSP
ncbi:MAG: LemA family protein [Armatimonadota bacterium]|nr:LemA family protein [Armatimonadota bacterium]